MLVSGIQQSGSHTHTYIHMKCWSLSCIQLFVTPWTVAHRLLCHGILRARMLEWVAILFSRRSSWPGDQTCVSCIAGRFFTVWATRKALIYTHKQVFTPCSVSVLQILSPYRLLQNTEYSSLCYTIGLSFIYTEVCVSWPAVDFIVLHHSMQRYSWETNRSEVKN